MKKIQYKRVILFCIITMIPVIIHIFNSQPEKSIWKNILECILTGLCLFLGSGMVSAIIALIMFLAGKGVIWLFEEKKNKEPDLESLFYAVIAVVFCIAYYELLTGRVIGVI